MRSKILIATAVAIITALGIFAGIQFLSPRKSDSGSAIAASAMATRGTATDRQIEIAENRINRLPSDNQGYNLLATAYLQKARETGNFEFNALAESALKRSLEIDANDRSTLTIHATLLLTYHRFREALEEAQRTQNLGLESAELYGIMTDAQVELGDYPAAVKAAQKMVNLRPDAAAYSRVSYLRALHGDLDGAIEAMRIAVAAAGPGNPENASWYRVQLGVELLNAGKREAAEREFDLALQIFPGYHLALAAKGRARIGAGGLETAVGFYRQAQERVPLPDYAIALGDLYTKLGRPDEAKRQYELVEFTETSSAFGATYSRQLALFRADHDHELGEALESMKRESRSRSDIYTLDVLAWCLFKNGQAESARASIEQAMRLGTRDARIFYHAGIIYGSLGDRRRAAHYLKMALDADPAFDISQVDVAREKLRELRGTANASATRKNGTPDKGK